MEEDPSERNVARYSRAAGRVRVERRLRGRERGAQHRRRPRAARRPPRPADRRAQRRRAAPRRAGPHPVRRQRRAAARRADEPPRRRRQGVAAAVPPHLPRRAARDQPRPRPARRGDHPGAAPRPARRGRPSARIVEYKGTYTPVPHVASADEERLARKAMLQAQGDRPPADDRRPLRGQGHEGGDGAQQGEADRPPRGAAGARRRGRPHAAGALPRSAAERCHGDRGDAACRRATAARRCSRTSRSTSAAASGCSCSASTAPARRACCGSSPARPTANVGDVPVRSQRQRRLLRAGARQPAPRRDAARQHPRRGAATA